MPRKTLDIDPELDALKARIEKRLTSHKLALGEIVLDSGIHKLFDADQLRDALIRLCDESASILAKGGKAAGTDTSFPAQSSKRPATEPARRGATDLLDQAAAE